MTGLTELEMTVGDDAVPARDRFEVIDPYSLEVVGTAPECTAAQLDRAVEAAQNALGGWSADVERRRGIMRQISTVVTEATPELAPLLVAEQGKPLADATREIAHVAAWFDYYAEFPWENDVIQDDAAGYVEVQRRPVGVVAAITPWNYPLVQAAWKIAPAFLAGCTVVLKPSPYTPLTSLVLGQRLSEVIPPGVLTVVTGGDEVGRKMVSHPAIRKVSFTGSVGGGLSVAAGAAADLKRVTLELGGNDAAIVLDDADPATVAAGLFGGAFANCGQVCTAIKRAFVPDALYDDVVAGLVTLAEDTVVGHGLDPEVTMGPINNLAQYERVSGLVEDARARGAVIAAGGGPGAQGYLYAPTIVAEATEGMRVVDEEQFGPALPVVRYTDIDDAVRRANDTTFGLSGSVWSSDVDRAAQVAGMLECGTTWVNRHRALTPAQPIGGVKLSGIGRENGRWGVEAFAEARVLSLPPR